MSVRALFVLVLLGAASGLAQAQSLAEIARAEAARRKDVNQSSKVYTNDSLKPDFTSPTPPPGTDAAEPAPAGGSGATEPGSAPASAAPAADTPARDQAYWSGRITEARSQLERSRAFASALQNRVDMLWMDFVNRDNPVERAGIEQERAKALAELERVRKEIDDHAKAITAIEDEARRAGVPSGWLRSS